MNLHHLKCALSVAKNGSINRAARELFVSQPYMSTVIRTLEKEMGFQIFRRTHAGVEPTELGVKFLDGAQRILAEAEELQKLKRKQAPSLRVVSYFSPYFMKCFLAVRNQGNASSQDSFQETSLPYCFQALAAQNVNLALICYVSTVRGYYERMAGSFQFELHELVPNVPFHVVMREEHPLSKEKTIPISRLLDYPFISFIDSSSFLKLMGLNEEKIDLITVSDRGSYFDMIGSSDSLALMALIDRDAKVRKDVRYIPLTGTECTMNFAYVIRKNYQVNPREKKLLRYIRENSILGKK